MGKMPFRQIHLDFHTGESISGVGSSFNKIDFQEKLKKGHVNAINIFAKCHHGWLYYQNGVTPAHPTLERDLLDEMLLACEKIGVETQIYISAGLDERIARLHPEWLYRNKDQSTMWAKDFVHPGYHELCMNTPYLDHLIAQIEEVTRRYETKGIWLDIVGARKCYCNTCINQLIKEGKNPTEETAIGELGERIFSKYLQAVEKAIKAIKPDMKIFHNSGHIHKGRRDYFKYYSQFELESLPTGGWGYDHLPLSARYVQSLGKEFLGMTGKFHSTWGEFGGFKHPNALRYEAALNLANGAKMCVGDQMHPVGALDEVTYNLIGEAYKEVEEKEPWCDDVTNVADVALLSSESAHKDIEKYDEATVKQSDVGAVRILLEGHYLFDVIDLEASLEGYKVIILPDYIRINEQLKERLDTFITAGGQILATGESGLTKDQDKFALDFGAKYEGKCNFQPDYLVPGFSYQGLGSTAFIMYSQGEKISLQDGELIGEREDPYFNREFQHFCSHFHTPNEPGRRSPAIVRGEAGIYVSWKMFEDYATKGSLILKETIEHALDLLLEGRKSLETTLPAQGVTTLQCQENKSRYVHHLLYATPVKRGKDIEIIEDIVPIYNVKSKLRLDEKITKVYLAPSHEEILFEQKDREVSYSLGKVDCHQMVVLEYA